ncbi:Protein CASC3 Cancer susceptibility candidate gene 3 protein-like protein [Larimichthys crocea]|uniref:Protein CASC3 n=1 Tax=Larimichthys crocea TaxID=215358 RepID=A0A6G0HU33_LARCR|nr:Protein CASC3 Cancer susceptibility candidate gene 3 protein-like protein [Larimichthys crocea]
MADRRRRRRRASQDSEDEDGSGSGSDSGRSGSPATKSRGREPDPPEAAAARVEAKSEESECESEDGVGEAVLSDYDSADPEENGSHSEGVEEEEEAEHYSDEEAPAAAGEPKPPTAADGPVKEEEQEEEQEEQEEEATEGEGQGQSKEENKAEEKGNLAGERQSGDGQESTDDPETKAGGKPGQKLDDDEDRKNPAYIPRKGLFFEHDVRGHAQEEERPKGRNRKLWKDEGRWEHDKFREEEQAPKSREELIAIYGYDIRNGGSSGDRSYRQRRPRQSMSPSRDKRWRDGGERPVRSWQSGGGGGGGGLNRGGAPPPSSIHPSSTSPSSLPLSHAQRSNNPSRPPPARSRPPHQNQMHLLPQQYRNNESNAPQMHPRERQGPKAPPEHTDRDRGVVRGGRVGGGRGGSSVVIEDVTVSQGGVREQDLSVGTTAASQPGGYKSASPRRQQQEQRGSSDRPASGLAASSSTSDPSPQSSAAATNREASPPTERPVERKSYSLARRTRSRPADLGSKQASVEESAAGGNNASSPSSVGGKSWVGAGEGASHTGGGGGGGGGGGAAMTELDQDVARLSLQSWSQSPTSYMRSEMRGLPNQMHMPGAQPQFSGMEEMGVGSNRAKRYSSQRQRAVPEPAPPMHLGVMEGHYYEPMSYQGPIYAHGDGPAPIPPQGMLVQPEMHLPHPGLHPHQSGGPIANPALYGGPPVSLSPGQPQQLLPPPPFYPPPGVMTFPYPAMYPSPQGQAQVTYGGVTYYDTMQQQAQPKPSPPRRTSQPVTVKPPPPEVHFASE